MEKYDDDHKDDHKFKVRRNWMEIAEIWAGLWPHDKKSSKDLRSVFFSNGGPR